MVLAMATAPLYVLSSSFIMKGPDGKAQDFKWYTYNEFWERIQDFASGLIFKDLVPEKDGVWLPRFPKS